MKIGIIGASLAGLTAGKKLADAGHDVTVIERNRTPGGRLATFDTGDGNIFDYGVSHFNARHRDFHSFVNELKEEGTVKNWTSRFEYFDGFQLHDINPNRSADRYYAAPAGMAVIAKKMSRWVDMKLGVKAGGLTHIGAGRREKRSWMINLTDISVFECDAVIIATPAPEAYGILQTTQDETPARRIIRYIDEIEYKPGFTVMALYRDRNNPAWNAVECMDRRLEWIINESSKRGNKDTSIMLHSSPGFAKSHAEQDPETVINLMLERAAGISCETWLGNPQWSGVRYWKYGECIHPMDEQFLELEMEEAPLAVVGDYLGGNTVESAYLSGLRLAGYWVQKYEVAEVER